VQHPIAELRGLRASAAPERVTGVSALPPSAEIELEVVRGDWKQAGLRLANAAGEEVVIGIAADPLELFVDRRLSRAKPFHDAYPGRHAGPLRWRGDRVSLHVFFDRTSLEVFANDGETVVSDRVYPTEPLTRLEIVGAAGPASLYALRSVWP